MGLPDFQKCVGAIAETMVQRDAPSAASAHNVATVQAFLLATHARMPDYLRLAFRLLVLTFDVWPCMLKGKPFHRLDFDHRVRQLDGWEHSRLGARRSLIAFYRALVTFGLSSERYRND